jgi:hypothetical protein
MKILWWDTEDPQDRIVLTAFVFLPLLYLFRGIGRSGVSSPNIDAGTIHRIGGLYSGYVGTGAWWTYNISFYLMAFLLLVVVISSFQVCLRWFRKHNAR